MTGRAPRCDERVDLEEDLRRRFLEAQARPSIILAPTVDPRVDALVRSRGVWRWMTLIAWIVAAVTIIMANWP